MAINIEVIIKWFVIAVITAIGVPCVAAVLFVIALWAGWLN